MSKTYEHNATVVGKPSKDEIIIEIKPEGACSSCSMEGICGSGKQVKRFTIKNELELKEGDEITVSITQKNLFLSGFLAYILPVITAISAGYTASIAQTKDIITALVTLLSVALYFILLRIILKNRNIDIKIDKKISG